ncbi:hypothetical protein ACFX2I_019673 [Malus domestica]
METLNQSLSSFYYFFASAWKVVTSPVKLKVLISLKILVLISLKDVDDGRREGWRGLKKRRCSLMADRVLVVSWVLQIHGEGEKMKENQHSFLCRFP